MNLDQLTEAVWEKLNQHKPRALLLGELPCNLQKYNYVNEKPYEAVVIGKLSPAQLLSMPSDPVCMALLEGIPVYLSLQGWERGKTATTLRRELCAAEQKLRRMGALPLETGPGLITAAAARQLRQAGCKPAPGSRLTPLAREILEGKEL